MGYSWYTWLGVDTLPMVWSRTLTAVVVDKLAIVMFLHISKMSLVILVLVVGERQGKFSLN